MFQESMYSLGQYNHRFGRRYRPHGQFDIVQPAEIYDPTKGQRATGRPNAFYVHPANLGETKKRKMSKYGGVISQHSTGVHFGKKQQRHINSKGRGKSNKLLLAVGILTIPVSLFVGWKIGKG